MRQILSFCRRRHEKAQKQNETAGARRFPGNCLQEKLKTGRALVNRTTEHWKIRVLEDHGRQGMASVIRHGLQ